ncbi:DUF2514 family protein [Variovorax sp. PAMC 28711]|uniref:DUF2514 family protein n=1 Tax=Variovorax sp. PAMC 28711 TaxID=1795631 RepID=UPI00078BBFD2|nr:DUF2514 family protein [Variovorax sp. PAMC 28711]AMM23153.1 hypothetical protein AX767_01280 [Variovorax sp. PAMC 28711]
MMALMSPKVWVALVIAFLLAMVGAQQVRVSNAKAAQSRTAAEFSAYQATQAESARLAERSRRDTEQRWAATVEGVSNEGQQKIDVARADAERAGAAEQRVQQRVAAFLSAIRRAAEDSGVATTGATASARSDPLDLLSYLFARADSTAGELAEALDRSRISGQTCEKAYDSLIAK